MYKYIAYNQYTPMNGSISYTCSLTSVNYLFKIFGLYFVP